MKKKRNKPDFLFRLPLTIKHGKHKIFSYEPDELVYGSEVFGEEIEEKELIVSNKKGHLTYIFFDKKYSNAKVHLICTLKDLKKFVASVEKRSKKLGSCWNHFNPELSFFVQEKSPKNVNRKRRRS